MTKRIFGFIAVPLVILCIASGFGCAPTITINGKEYRTLSKKEETRLIAEARGALKKASKKFTDSEQRRFAGEDPTLNYRFNLQDEPNFVDICWELPDRKVVVMMARNVEDKWVIWALRYDPTFVSK